MARRTHRMSRAHSIRFCVQVDKLDERNLVSTLTGFAAPGSLAAGTAVALTRPSAPAPAPAGRASSLTPNSSLRYDASNPGLAGQVNGPARMVVSRTLPTPTIELTVGKPAEPGLDWLDLRNEEAAPSNGVAVFSAPARSAQPSAGSDMPEAGSYGGAYQAGAAPAAGRQGPVAADRSAGAVATAGSNAITPLYLPAPAPTGGAHNSSMATMDASGGSGGSGGGVGPAPLMVDLMSGRDWIGCAGNIGVRSPDETHIVKSVHWTWSGDPGVYDYQDIQLNTNNRYTFQNHLKDPNTLDGDGASGGFVWGPTPGFETFTAEVTYLDGSVGVGSMIIEVKEPNLQLTVDGVLTGAGATPRVKNNTFAEFSQNGTAPSDSSMHWDASITDTDYTGQVVVMQLITDASAGATTKATQSEPSHYYQGYTKLDSNNNIISPGFNLTDSSLSSVFYAPPDGLTAEATDTPNIYLPGIYNADHYDKALQFKTIVMAGGGLYVPLASWTWGFDISANLSGTQWTASNNSPPNYTAPQADSSYPTWWDSVALWNQYNRVS